MKARPVTSIDYASVLVLWWLEQGWTPPPPALLSPHGYIVETTDGTPVLAGWLYDTGSTCGLCEHLIGNPAFKLERRQALPVLLAAISKAATSRGITALLTFSNHATFIQRLESCGFEVTDQSVTHLVKRLS